MKDEQGGKVSEGELDKKVHESGWGWNRFVLEGCEDGRENLTPLNSKG